MTSDKLAATFHGASLTDTLRPILEAYRQEVQPHWSPASAHPDFDGKQGGPAGQCGVTSAWAQRRLREDHGIVAWYCAGAVRINHHVVQAAHCWLEINDGRDWLVVDLTAGQIPRVSDLPILYAAYSELRQDGIAYLYRRRFTAEQLLADPVQGRLAVLTSEVGR